MIAFHALQMGSAFCGEKWSDLSFEFSGVEIDPAILRQNIVIMCKLWLVFEVIKILDCGEVYLDYSNFCAMLCHCKYWLNMIIRRILKLVCENIGLFYLILCQ